MSERFDAGLLRRRSSWVAIGVAAVVVIGIAAVMLGFWAGLGDTGISAAGWVAMAVGVFLTLALGIGLMALVFISNRRGFDEPAETPRPPPRR